MIKTPAQNSPRPFQYGGEPPLSTFFSDAISCDHHCYEEMAKNATDVNGSDQIGCWIGIPINVIQGEDIVVRVYVPKDEGNPGDKSPVIVFGATRFWPKNYTPDSVLQSLSDFRADVDSLEIGAYRWAYNEGLIRQLINILRERYHKRPVLTGYSLGGALAQITACNYWNFIDSVVTFQSPRIGRSIVQIRLENIDLYNIDSAASKSFHYVMDDDLVSKAGYIFSPGYIVQYKMHPNNLHLIIESLLPLVTAVRPDMGAGLAAANQYIAIADRVRDIWDAHTRHFFWGRIGNDSVNCPDIERVLVTRTETQLQNNSTEVFRRQIGPLLLGVIFNLPRVAFNNHPAIRILLECHISHTPIIDSLITAKKQEIYVLLWEYIKGEILGDVMGSDEINELSIPFNTIYPDLGNFGNLRASFALNEEQKSNIRRMIRYFDQNYNDRPLYFSHEPPLIYAPPSALRERSSQSRSETRDESRYLMDRHGYLTEAGIAHLKSVYDNDNGRLSTGGLSEDDIRTKFLGNYVSGEDGVWQWRESVITQEVKNIFQLREGYIFGDGIIRFPKIENNVIQVDGNSNIVPESGSPPITNNRHNIRNTPEARNPRKVFCSMENNRPKFIAIVQNEIGVMLNKLKFINNQVIPVTENDFRLTEENIDNLRRCSVMRYLVYKLRLDDTLDESLARRYCTCHSHFVNMNRYKRSEPLNLLPSNYLRDTCMQVTDDFNFEAFNSLALNKNRYQRGSLEYSEARLMNIWYKFLFRVNRGGGGVGFIANHDNVDVRDNQLPFVSNAMNHCILFTENNSTDCIKVIYESGNGIKLVRQKRPDMILIHVDQEKVEVIDATMRFDQPIHNFKTEFYTSVFRHAFRNYDWEVIGIDYKSARQMNITSS